MLLRLDHVRVEGSTVFTDAELGALFADLVGTEVTLQAVYDLAARLTAKYGEAGFVLSRATIPPQEIDPSGAVVTIRIIEGNIDDVVWPPETARYRDFFSDYATRITREHPANINTVMRYLLLAGDLPGIDVTSRFQASETNPQASTLIVEMTEKTVDGSVQIDNRGTEGRGPWQYSASATVGNLLGLHEALTFGYAGTVETKELQHLSAGYRQVLSSEGLFAFANVSLSWGAPGTAALEALAFNTKSLAADIGFGLPVIRSRDRNLTLSASAFLSNSYAEMLGAPSSDDRLRGVRLAADFDYADAQGGVTAGTVTFSQGFAAFGASANGDPLASRENGRVDFTTLAASLSRTQPLGSGFSFRAATAGQLALTPLLSPEECGYGGQAFGRAFDPSEITGDSCWSIMSELRFDPDVPQSPFDLAQLYAFVDYGRVYRLAPSAGTPTTEHGASAGVGLRLGTEQFSADLSAVKPLFGRADDDWQFFVSASARY